MRMREFKSQSVDSMVVGSSKRSRGPRLSTLDYLVTKMRKRVKSPSVGEKSPPRLLVRKIIRVDDDVDVRISEDEDPVETEDAAVPASHHRPPIYNPEDYAFALTKFARMTNLYVIEFPKDKKSRAKEKEKNIIKDGFPEMSLKQFASLPDLLKKLKEDLKNSYISFVKEFVRDPNDGVTLLLDVLKMVQLAQTNLHGCISSREQQMALRRALIDEHECLSCLRHCLRCSDTTHKLANYHYGLYALAVATMSNLARSRTLTLQLLTKACETSPIGHRQVIDALATLRLRFAEPVRCKFLVSMMLSQPQPSFQMWALRFVNTLIASAESLRERIYIQEELMEAGFDASSIRKMLERVGDTPQKLAALSELNRWSCSYVDIEALGMQLQSLREANLKLEEELKKLREANMKLLEENVILKTVGSEMEDRNAALQRRLENHGLPSAPSPVPSVTDSDLSSLNTVRNTINSKVGQDDTSSCAESRTDSTLEGDFFMAPMLNGHDVLLKYRNSTDNSLIVESRSGSQSRSDASTVDSTKTVRQVLETKQKDLLNKSTTSVIKTEEKITNNSHSNKTKGNLQKFNESMPITNIDMTLRDSEGNPVTVKQISSAETRGHPSYENINSPGHDDKLIYSKPHKTPSPPLITPDKNGGQKLIKESSSTSTSSLSSVSSGSSFGGGCQMENHVYQNVSNKETEKIRKRGTNEDGELDYQKDVIVYEAITLGNDTIVVDKTNTQQSNGSKTSCSSGSSKENSSVRMSVRHYENLANEENSNDCKNKSNNKKEKRQKSGKNNPKPEAPRKKIDRKGKFEVLDKEVEAVINGLENVLNNAETTTLPVSPRNLRKDISGSRDSFEDRASPEHQLPDEIEIVPTRLPQLPSRSRSRNTSSHSSIEQEPVIILEYDSPAETSDSDALINGVQRTHSPHTMETESTKSFGFIKPDKAIRRHGTFMERSNNGIERRTDRKSGLKRSESFQLGNNADYNSHRSYSPKRRGSADLISFEESQVNISGRTFTRYTPQEVERRNRVNDIITAEMRRRNRSLDDRLDQWIEEHNEDWTLEWKYPEIQRQVEESRLLQQKLKRQEIKKTSKNKQVESSKQSSSSHSNGSNASTEKNSSYGESPVRPSRSHKPHRFSNSEISAFNGFKNPNTGFKESDYGPNFMLNKPNNLFSNYFRELKDFTGREFQHPKSRGGRRKLDIDPDIPTPDYTATPAGTLSTIVNGKSQHILDMPSGLY